MIRPPLAARARAALAAIAYVSLLVAGAGWIDTAVAADKPSSTVEAAMARDRRVALLIGNSRYASAPLANPVNDARAMGETLRTLGFRVTVLEDASITQISEAVRKFGDTLQAGGVGLFFYAGHGMQIKGRNYLIPIGADIQREDEVAFNAFDASQVQERMEAAKSRVNIVILDACRNNPFTRSFRSSTQGLASMDAPSGSYLALATAPGRVAGDGNEGNGVYTQNLLEAIRTPGIKIEDVFKRTRIKVMAATDNQQVPWDYSSLSGDFYFIPTDAAAAAQLANAPALALAPAPVESARTRRDAQRNERAEISSPPAATMLAKAAHSDTTMLAKASHSDAGVPASVAPKVDRGALEASYRKGMDAKGSDLATASESLGKAAEGGHPAAAYELGLLLKTGRKPLQQDLPRAQRMFQLAADSGHVAAQYEAAQGFSQGLGVTKNCAQATTLALKAARAGSIEAALLAGDLNKSDCSGARNLQESARWYRVAADKGLAPAQFALGVLYVNGEGVTKDAAEARKWLSAAAGQGSTPAKFYLDRLGR